MTASSFPVRIEHGKLREFARAAMAADGVWHDAVIPPTFLTTAGYFWEPPESKAATAHGLDPARVLHAEQEYVFHRPPPQAGQVLTATARITDRYTKHGRRGGELTFVTRVVEFRDEHGDLVVEQRSVSVQTARAPR